jgi:hypothetical protein
MTSLLLFLCIGFSRIDEPELTQLANWSLAKKALILAPEHRAALAKNGFFVCPGSYEQLFDIYGQNDYDNLSSLITVDNVIDLYHVFFDSTLRQVEEKHLLPSSRRMSESMLAASAKRYARIKGGPLESAALKNIAYFGVAERLAGGQSAIPEAALPMVRAELALIDAHAGFATSAIFPYDVDYSQFIVRGHYARSVGLGRYFKTMMWYGLVPVALEDKDRKPLAEQVRQTAMMVEDLYGSSALPEWKRIYGVSSMYAGDSNDLTPADWKAATDRVLGTTSPEAKLASDASVPELVAAAKTVAHAAIVSKRIEGTRAGELQFRFMGQRANPDSVVFNNLTNEMRPWPSPLDVGVVMGSRRAAAILDADPATYNPKHWPGYVSQRTEDAANWAAQPESYWRANLYNGTLDVLGKAVAPPAGRAPAFMRSSAWADRCLSVALAGWADLRHDTILYGEQSVSEMGDGDEPQPVVKSYVEPNLALYQRLIELTKQTAAGLERYGYLANTKFYDKGNAERFTGFEDLLSFFVSVSRRELSGGRLSAAEHMRLRKIEADLSDLWTTIQLAGTNYQILNQDDNDMAIIADVHTAGNEALEVGVGHADDLVAIVPIEGKQYLARGSALSYYEFRVPIAERVTDHDWKAYLESGKGKPRPPWTASFFIDKPCHKFD